MESIINSTENVQIVDSESSGVAADCLGIPLILQKVLGNLSPTELLQVSLVNKQWNYEARSVLKHQDRLTARIKGHYPCPDLLRAFASSLRNMNVVPFSGISIDLGTRLTDGDSRHLCELSQAELGPIYKDILERLPWKHFSVTVCGWWEDYLNCTGLGIVKKILQNFCSVIEEFTLEVEDDRSGFVEKFVQPCCYFPRLKTLRLRDRNIDSTYDLTKMIKMLVPTAPNLQILYTEGRVDFRQNLLEGSSAVHVSGYEYSPSLGEIPESVAGQLRVEKMDLKTISQDFSMDRFNTITSALILTSRSTLSSMHINAKFLVSLTFYGICMENVRKFEIDLNTYNMSGTCGIQPSIQRAIKLFDFNRLFPKLNTVAVNWCSLDDSVESEFDEMIAQGNIPLVEPMPDRAVNIKNLTVNWSKRIFEDDALPFFAEMFPDVRNLSIKTQKISFDRLWVTWSDLEELHVTLAPITEHLNLDMVFCGILPDEITKLREQDDEYLRSVNIVAGMPSITCLKGLRKFNFRLNRTNLYSRRFNEPTFVLSKVTPLIAFQRCPNLSVTVATHGDGFEKVLDHLKPYVSVIFDSTVPYDD